MYSYCIIDATGEIVEKKNEGLSGWRRSNSTGQSFIEQTRKIYKSHDWRYGQNPLIRGSKKTNSQEAKQQMSSLQKESQIWHR